MGIELHYKLESNTSCTDAVDCDGQFESWVYDSNHPNGLKLQDNQKIKFRPPGYDASKINRLWINSNKHDMDAGGGGITGEYYCGDGMDCVMYVDDFIVDNQRVGPTYFSLLNGNPLPPPTDTTAPSQITNLSSSNITETSVNLSWTSPGDDNNTGTASTYDIRYSTSPITNTNWNTALPLTGEPNPGASGITQTYTVAGLSSNTTYYFAIKTQDEVPNISLLSNVVSVATQSIASQPWQQTLKQNFAHVETFDELQDWGNGLTGDPNSIVTTNLPQKTTGGQGLIDAWQWDGNGGIQGNAIANHGQADVFRGNGKSLKLGYDWQGKAPSKIDIHIDDGTGNGGYNEAHVFFMVKMPNFLPNDGIGIYWWDALKFFYPAMGFRAPKQFGTPAFAALNPVTNAAVINSYGENMQIINIHGGDHMAGLAGKADFISSMITANNDCSDYQHQAYGVASSYNSRPVDDPMAWHFDNNLNPLYFAHDWFGITRVPLK